jgi:hypothetical protein
MRWRHRHTPALPCTADKQTETPKRRSLSSISWLILASLVSTVPGPARAQSTAQTAGQLPSKWNDAVQALAEKIANLAGRTRVISLEVRNISSLSAENASVIRRSLDAGLNQRQFRLVPESETQVVVTLSEGVDGYVWVAEVDNDRALRVEMVSTPKPEVVLENRNEEALLLEKKLAWQQPLKFLDFAVVTTPDGSSSTLVILEPDRFAYYRSSDGTPWQFWQAVPIPHSSVLEMELRDPRGFIDKESGLANLPGVGCTQSLDPDKARCAPNGQKLVFPWRRRIKVPGHEDSETIVSSGACGEESIVLSTANGDWTQPDRIQGYLVGALDEEVRASGAPIPVEGPVISLIPDARQGRSARAVVHNLNTGNYEAYVITANCSH